MNPERWRQIEQLYHAAMELDRSERGAFLQQRCGDDPALLNEVEVLIASHDAAGSFLGAPAWDKADNASESISTPSLVGQSFGRYQLLSVLGTGGTATVYLAEDTRLERRIALKLLPSRFFDEPEQVRRFEQEVRAISALNHPNIVAVYDTGETDAGRFIITEFVAGRTVRALQSERQPLAPCVHLIRQVAQALAAAHARVSFIATSNRKTSWCATMATRKSSISAWRDCWVCPDRLLPCRRPFAPRAACCWARCTICRRSRYGANR
jgi:hypothetical protein